MSLLRRRQKTIPGPPAVRPPDHPGWRKVWITAAARREENAAKRAADG